MRGDGVTTSASPLKVLFLINSLAGGGAERVMASILAGSHGRFAGDRFALALLDDEPDAYALPPWLPVFRLSSGGSLPRGFRQVRALVRRERPSLIVSFLTRANVIAAVVGRLERTPVVLSERVNTSAHLQHARLSRLLVRLSYGRADRVIAVSQGVADDLAANFAVSKSKLRVIANPVDFDAIRARALLPEALPADRPFLVAVGRLTATKNMTLLLRGYAASGIASHLVILGEGPERAMLEAEARTLGVEDRVSLPGFVANPSAVVAKALAYVSTSNGEGFPNALVEAMALARPVIATNCASGPSEILADRARETVPSTLNTPFGKLIPVNDQTALVDALRWAQGLSATEREEIGGKGAERAEEYGVDVAVERYWHVFDEVAAGKR